MDHRAFLFLLVFPFFPTCTRGKINFSYFQICTRIRRNGRRRMAPFCLWRALWKVCSEWKMCLHSTILFSWKNTRFRSVLGERESMETGANVYFSCLWLSFFSFSFFTRSILGIYLSPSVSFLLLYISSPPPFFVPLAIKFYERRNGFSRLIAWIFSTIKRFKLTNNIFTTTFRGEIESGNFCLNSCTAFERSEATTCRFNRQHKVITWLRYENTTRILRSRARAFPFASLFARMRLAPMRVPQIVLQNARFSSFATNRPNWINPELKGISKRACYVK